MRLTTGLFRDVLALGVDELAGLCVVALDIGDIEALRSVLQAQTQASQLDLDLVDGLLAEVTDVQQVGLRACSQLADGVNLFTLQAVVGADGEVQIGML